MKRKGILLVVLMALVLSLVPACAQPTVNWTLGTAEPKLEDWNIAPLVELGDRISARTDGKFTIHVTIGKELGVERKAIATLLSDGVVQMAFLTGSAVGHFPHLEVHGLPFLVGSGGDPLTDGHKIEAALADIDTREFGKLGIAPYNFLVMTPVQIISKEPIEDASDLKGMKIRAWNEGTANIIKAIGGEPVIMSITETYVSMQTGVVDGVLTGVPAMISMSLYEPGKHLTLINLAPGQIHNVYNIEAFEALPEDYQKMLIEEEKTLHAQFIAAQPKVDKASLEELKGLGVEVREVPPEVRKRMVTQVKPLWEAWGAKSPLNRETLDTAMAALGL
jgi:TRAP-type C4-dicarboxylate transport system substrate-binding protein